MASLPVGTACDDTRLDAGPPPGHRVSVHTHLLIRFAKFAVVGLLAASLALMIWRSTWAMVSP